MAQRGGSVVAHLRYGAKVYSPLIEPGTVDIEVAFETLESIRYLPYLNGQSKVIINTQKILPAPVSTGMEAYPGDVLDQLASRRLAVFPMDAFELARSVGETRAVNMVLVGALSVFLPVKEEIFLEVIAGRISEKIRKLNTEAFFKGRDKVNVLQGRKTETR